MIFYLWFQQRWKTWFSGLDLFGFWNPIWSYLYRFRSASRDLTFYIGTNADNWLMYYGFACIIYAQIIYITDHIRFRLLWYGHLSKIRRSFNYLSFQMRIPDNLYVCECVTHNIYIKWIPRKKITRNKSASLLKITSEILSFHFYIMITLHGFHVLWVSKVIYIYKSLLTLIYNGRLILSLLEMCDMIYHSKSHHR